MKLLGIDPHDLETVRGILQTYVPVYEVRVFGSRVHGRTIKKFSDLDIAVITETPLDTLLIAELKNAFTESDLPFKVDIIDWAVTGKRFKAIVEKEYLVIQEGGRESGLVQT
jgi:predicted nucleotidyltransferase